MFFVNSCTKNDTRPETGTRLQKLAINIADSLGFLFFKYDQDNRLTKLIVSDDKDGITGSITTLTYDSEGRVSTLNYPYGAPYVSTDTLIYYNNGGSVKKTGSLPMSSSHLYSFDARHRIISDSALAGDGSVMTYAIFRYDQNDNLIEWNVYDDIYWRNSWASVGNTFFSYDNRKSPLSDLGQLLYITTGEYGWLGKNNVTQTKFSKQTWPTIFSYEYTVNGLPKKVIGRQNNEVVLTYECYYD